MTGDNWNMRAGGGGGAKMETDKGLPWGKECKISKSKVQENGVGVGIKGGH